VRPIGVEAGLSRLPREFAALAAHG
jgi:hypothetical protein